MLLRLQIAQAWKTEQNSSFGSIISGVFVIRYITEIVKKKMY